MYRLYEVHHVTENLAVQNSGRLLSTPDRYLSHCSNGLDGNVLRFSARLVTDSAIDASRRFILSFFLSDDTIAIYEVPEPNSGECTGLGRDDMAMR